MAAERKHVSFGVKTSQQGLTYADILRFWTQADQIPVFEDACLWDHMLPLRGCTHLVLAPRPPHFSPAWVRDEIVDPVLDVVEPKS